MMANIQSEIWINGRTPTNQRCHLRGYLTNEVALRKQLKIAGDDPQVLLEAALKQWGHQVNQHLVGDYVIVWNCDNQLLITSSARSSFTVYYQTDKSLIVSSDLSRLGKVVNQSQLMQNLVLGPLDDSHTPFKDVNRLQSGETLTWQTASNLELSHQTRLPHDKQLELAQLVCLPEAAVLETKNIDLADLFNQLPRLAHRLGQPLTDAGLAHFDQLVGETDEQVILLDSHWLQARNQIGERPFEHSDYWCKNVFKRRFAKNRQQLKKTQKRLATAYETSETDHSFTQWLDLHYVLPAWCQLLQDIAALHGKILINPFLAQQAITSKKAPQSYFSFEQPSISNIFDSMQRLFQMGEPNTNTLFELNPQASASVVKQHQYRPRQVEQFCIKLLTFDYLSRFTPLTLNP